MQIYESKSTQDASLAMFLLFTQIMVLWLTYGLMVQSFSVVAASPVTLLLSLVVLFFKFIYRNMA
jgi:MtN3 and saliva related transmembrane protein